MGGSVLGTERASKLIREMASATCLADPKVLIMLSAYCGGSGMQGGPQCFLGGYAADVDRWANFCDKWQPLCERYLRGKPLRISESSLPAAALAEFAECIVDHVTTELWTAAPEFYLEKLQTKHGVQYDKYRLCFHGLLDATANDDALRELNEPLTWWFGHPDGSGDGPNVDLPLSLVRAFLDKKSLLQDAHKHMLNSIHLADEQTTLPLQAARFFVDLKRQHWSTPDSTPEPPALTILRGSDPEDNGAKLHRVQLVWFDHTLEDSMRRLTAAEKH